jgi:hypothetical protein
MALLGHRKLLTLGIFQLPQLFRNFQVHFEFVFVLMVYMTAETYRHRFNVKKGGAFTLLLVAVDEVGQPVSATIHVSRSSTFIKYNH